MSGRFHEIPPGTWFAVVRRRGTIHLEPVAGWLEIDDPHYDGTGVVGLVPAGPEVSNPTARGILQWASRVEGFMGYAQAVSNAATEHGTMPVGHGITSLLQPEDA